ncbi:MAG: OmpA family protein [Bdellovibrio sp.]|nr:OmpA family protein [Bdellovibrio sp.]
MSEARQSKTDLADLSPLREEDTAIWMTSYSDLVTLLLCFFILFFAIFAQKQAQEMEKQAKQAMTIAEEKVKAMQQPKTIGLLAEEINEKFAKLENVYSLVYELPGIETVKKRDHFLIVFSDGNFFDAGSYELNIYGQYRMALVLERLIPYANELFIEIQGHADNTPITHKYENFKTNIELSALRAIGVYNYFLQFGFPEESMSIAGYSYHRPIIDDKEDEEIILQRNRRVTFRVEAK